MKSDIHDDIKDKVNSSLVSPLTYLYDFTNDQAYLNIILESKNIRMRKKVKPRKNRHWSSTTKVAENLITENVNYFGCDCIQTESVEKANFAENSYKLPLGYIYKIRCKKIQVGATHKHFETSSSKNSFFTFFEPCSIEGYSDYDLVLTSWMYDTDRESKRFIRETKSVEESKEPIEQIRILLKIPEIPEDEFMIKWKN